MLTVVRLKVVFSFVLSVIMLNVVLLSVVAQSTVLCLPLELVFPGKRSVMYR